MIGTTVQRAYIYSVATSPPLYCSVIQSPANCCQVDWNIGLIVTAGDLEDGGKLSMHKFSIGSEVTVSPTLTGIEIGKGARCLRFSQSRSEVYIGYENGVIGVVALRTYTKGLICSWQFT